MLLLQNCFSFAKVILPPRSSPSSFGIQWLPSPFWEDVRGLRIYLHPSMDCIDLKTSSKRAGFCVVPHQLYRPSALGERRCHQVARESCELMALPCDCTDMWMPERIVHLPPPPPRAGFLDHVESICVKADLRALIRPKSAF